jgi:hypothetical protein
VDEPRRTAVVTGSAAAVAFAVVAVFFVLPYLTQDVAYPLGWDSPFYVWRSAAVGVDGLARIGGIRPATPLLFHALDALTGEGPFTIAAIAPALFAATAGLAAAGLLRAAFGIGAAWVPVVALIAWMGFGHPGMVREQPDNVLNAALVLAAFAAAVTFVRGGRGWTATLLALIGAGLAHWPFFALAIGVLGLAVLLFGGRRLLRPGEDGAVRRARALLGAGAAAAGVVGAGALWRPAAAWTAPRLSELRDILADRFRRRIGDGFRVPVLPLAGLGLAVASRRRDRPERRLFLCLMVAWLVLTAVGVALQAAGVPTAGIRLLNNLFPLTLLAAVLVWYLGTTLGGRWAMAITAAVLVGLGALAVPFQLHGRAWYEPAAVEQAAAAGAWLQANAPDATIGFVLAPTRDRLSRERWRNTILAALPPAVAARTVVDQAPDADVLVAIAAYNPKGGEALLARGGRPITSHVVALGAIPADAPVGASPPGPSADTRSRAIAFVLILGALALWASGLGWSLALLPADPLLVWTLAPALGCAATAILGVAWAALGLPLDGAAGAGPLALAAVTGTGAALLRRSRPG